MRVLSAALFLSVSKSSRRISVCLWLQTVLWPSLCLWQLSLKHWSLETAWSSRIILQKGLSLRHFRKNLRKESKLFVKRRGLFHLIVPFLTLPFIFLTSFAFCYFFYPFRCHFCKRKLHLLVLTPSSCVEYQNEKRRVCSESCARSLWAWQTKSRKCTHKDDGRKWRHRKRDGLDWHVFRLKTLILSPFPLKRHKTPLHFPFLLPPSVSLRFIFQRMLLRILWVFSQMEVRSSLRHISILMLFLLLACLARRVWG